MAQGQSGSILGQIHRLFSRGTVAGLSEWELLRRYATDRDEVAFEALVIRHGPMVLGVCRRLLDDPHAVEDAFQATFLVLVRRARSLRERDVLGLWLYGVASRVALRARSEAYRRRVRERPGGEVAAMEQPRCEDDDLRGVLDDELSRLPDKYRRPIVLCYLEGATHEDAARQLGWPIGSVKGRLARARDLLRDRLARRGVALPSTALIASLSRDATAAIPPALLASTIGAAMQIAAGKAALGVVSASVADLLEGVIQTMTLAKIKLAASAIIALGLATGAGVLAYQDSGPGNATGRSDDATRSIAKADPTRTGGRPSETNPPPEAADRPGNRASAVNAKDLLLQVEKRLAQRDQDRWNSADEKTRAILRKLDEPVPIAFPDETPLVDALKYIKSATQKPDDNGLPIYVDPAGLQEAEKTMQSPIQLDLDGIPLKITLRLMLEQLGLVYEVKDGLMHITAEESASSERSALARLEELAGRGELSLDELHQLIETLTALKEIEKIRFGDSVGGRSQ